VILETPIHSEAKFDFKHVQVRIKIGRKAMRARRLLASGGCVILMALGLSFNDARANSVLFDLTVSSSPAFSAGSDYAYGMVSVIGDAATFRLNTNISLSGFSGAEIKDFFFNSTVPLSSSNFNGLPTGWKVISTKSGKAGSLGTYTVKIGIGSGVGLLPPSLTFTITNSAIYSVSQFLGFSTGGSSKYQFAAEFADINGKNSGVYFAGNDGPLSTPEPCTLLLVGSTLGLSGLNLLRRKFKK
jgi:hypothetical protein